MPGSCLRTGEEACPARKKWLGLFKERWPQDRGSPPGCHSPDCSSGCPGISGPSTRYPEPGTWNLEPTRITRPVPEWRNWQTHQTQNLARLTSRGGSIPPSGTSVINNLRRLPFSSHGFSAAGVSTLSPLPSYPKIQPTCNSLWELTCRRVQGWHEGRNLPTSSATRDEFQPVCHRVRLPSGGCAQSVPAAILLQLTPTHSSQDSSPSPTEFLLISKVLTEPASRT